MYWRLGRHEKARGLKVSLLDVGKLGGLGGGFSEYNDMGFVELSSDIVYSQKVYLYDL